MTGLDSRQRRARWGMALSIALNVFLLGLIGGMVLHHRDSDALTAAAGQVSSADLVRTLIRQLADNLPPEDGRVLREAFRARVPDLIRLQRRSVQAADQVRRDIGEKDLDTDRLRADLQAAREARQALRPVLEQALLDALPRMSPAGRRMLSDYRVLTGR